MIYQKTLASSHRSPRVRAAEERMFADLTEETFNAFCLERDIWQNTDPVYQAVADLYRSHSWGPKDHMTFARIFSTLERESL